MVKTLWPAKQYKCIIFPGRFLQNLKWNFGELFVLGAYQNEMIENWIIILQNNKIRIINKIVIGKNIVASMISLGMWPTIEFIF